MGPDRLFKRLEFPESRQANIEAALLRGDLTWEQTDKIKASIAQEQQ